MYMLCVRVHCSFTVKDQWNNKNPDRKKTVCHRPVTVRPLKKSVGTSSFKARAALAVLLVAFVSFVYLAAREATMILSLSASDNIFSPLLLILPTFLNESGVLVGLWVMTEKQGNNMCLLFCQRFVTFRLIRHGVPVPLYSGTGFHHRTGF